MELDASDVVIAVSDGHDGAVIGAGGDREAIRKVDLVHQPGVVQAGRERSRQRREQVIREDRRDLPGQAVTDGCELDEAGAEGAGDCLMSEADSEQRLAPLEALDQPLHPVTRFRQAGAGRKENLFVIFQPVRYHAVGPDDIAIGARILPQQMGQVVDEGVEIIDQGDFHERPIVKNVIAEVNRLGAAGTPFLLVVDFELQQPLLHEISSLPTGLMFTTPRFHSHPPARPVTRSFTFRRQPPGKEAYARAFRNVMAEIRHGNSFLVNFTLPTPVETDLTLAEIYHLVTAKYRCCLPDEFVCFSPEIFVRIEGGRIYSYPMKGTIDATLPDAAQRILADPKEEAEHNTIVDLIRNDLSMVAADVRVDRFRYLDRIETRGKPLLQVSSQISGQLPADHNSRLGDIIFTLLPAGSVSGAPKPDTLRIIRESEPGPRGYYAGIMAYYDGESLDSAVLIRFLEKRGDRYLYRSGGGITFQSDLDAEYQELVDKVYLPIG